MEISDRIQQRMSALGLKGVDITRETGVSSGGVSQWVNGLTKPNGEKLIALSKALKCEPDWLLYGGKDDPSEVAGSSAMRNVMPGPEIAGRVPLISWVQAGEWTTIVDSLNRVTLKNGERLLRKSAPCLRASRSR